MSKKLLPIIVLTFLTLSIFAVLPVAAEPVKPIVVAHSKGALGPDVALGMMLNYSKVEWREVYGEVTEEDLVGATVYIWSMADASAEYTAAEESALISWLAEGGKTAWITGESDYPTDVPRIAVANQILEAVGSVLRVEETSVEDAVSNGGGGYRVLAHTAIDPMFAAIGTGVERALLHGPGLVAVEDGGLKSIEEAGLDNVYVLLQTTETGIIADSSEPLPTTVDVGQEGEFPVMAMELDYDKENVIITSGDAPFGHYAGMYDIEQISDKYYGRYHLENPQQGGIFVENLLEFAVNGAGAHFDAVAEAADNAASIAALGEDLSDLNDNIDSLAAEKSALESDASGLEADISALEADVTAAQSSASTMQLAAVAALVIGVVVGYFVGPMIKKD
jgi:hypothetical protein